MTLDEARDVLRVDAGANDELILALVWALPEYIEVVTGLKPELQQTEPLVKTVEKFILTLWYFADKADDTSLNRTIDNLLRAITVKAKRYGQ
jgi:hypothetical protein